jgi:uncharacterized protein (TIGR03083 family)
MPTSTPAPWLTTLRRSHDRVVRRTADLDVTGLTQPSYDSEWTIADVLSHLGSQAEIFGLLVEAGLTGGDAPGPEAFGPIWDVWNARSPEEQRSESTTANEALLHRLEGLEPGELEAFRLAAFGTEVDAAGLLRMRLSEHAVHAWDIEVVFQPDSPVAADAVELLVDGLPEMAARSGKPSAQPATIEVVTTQPDRRFGLVTGGVRLEPVSDGSTAESISGSVHLTGEALVRLVYGRLDDEHLGSEGVEAIGITLDELRAIFPGF